jgi:hypothetical protein
MFQQGQQSPFVEQRVKCVGNCGRWLRVLDNVGGDCVGNCGRWLSVLETVGGG